MLKHEYDLAMLYLDLIEIELDKIATHFGHPSMAEFFKDK
jgi:hypothetical protein